MNENKTERVRFEGVDAFSVSAMFVAMENRGYARKKFTPTSDVSHLEIYQYLSATGDKFTLVYDTKAKILTVDGRTEALTALAPLLPGKQPDKPQTGVKPPSAPVQTLQPAPPAKGSAPSVRPVSPAQPQRQKAAQPKKQVQDKPKPQPEKNKPAATPAPKPPAKPAKKTEHKEAEPAVKPVTIKNVSLKRLEWVVKDFKDSEGVKVRVTTASFDKTKAMTLTSKNKEIVELVRDERGNVSLSGPPCALLTDLRAQLESKSDIKLLRKYIPTALRYLSESSRIDLSNGITDLNNISRLSDYSVLLMAPYRALEKFIYDLQQAENINVKMIGQAYEKDDEGRYSLKKGYRKKINSVVYAEVMAALYTEYFKTRNFYTHSDNSSGSQSRGISDKAEAQKLLTHLLSVIEYNGKKLSEINFSVVEEN